MDKIYLWKDESVKTKVDRPSIKPFLLNDGEKHPAVLVIPGGGYGLVCERTEGTPIARKFNELGYHAFVLDYRTAPNRFPAPQLDAMRAMKIIRANADIWDVDADWIASCGFSAGGHLAGSLGMLCDNLDASDGDEADNFSHKPNVMILCYGVLAFEDWSHLGTQENLLGENFADIADKYSLPRLVNDQTPPAFVMHTVSDQLVPYRNSLVFADAMAQHKRPCELALYYWGAHGMLLGNDTFDVVNWPMQAADFIDSLRLAETDPDFLTRYTNSYQGKTI